MKGIKLFLFYMYYLFLATLSSCSQTPDFANAASVFPGDSIAIIKLIENGYKVEKGKVIAWFPKDSLSKIRIKGIVDTLNLGITLAEKFIKAPHEWQVHVNKSYTFYFRADSFISHASLGGFISIPFWRMKEGKAPWLHEAVHEMLNTKTGHWMKNKGSQEKFPLWLQEGLPEYIALQVSQQNRLSFLTCIVTED